MVKKSKKTPAKKTPAKKTPAKKTPAKKATERKRSEAAVTAKKPLAKKQPQKTAKTDRPPQATLEHTRKETLKKQLIRNREEIVREAKSEIAKYITGEARQLVESVLDDGDWSVVDLSEDVNLRRLAAHREVLLKIDEALRKLREGTYGICEDCGDTIHTERLKVLPFAIYCRDCQEKREELQKVGSEEL